MTGLSLTVDDSFDSGPRAAVRAVFYGLGADGTVGANKNTVKIIGDQTDLLAQGYFVYDSKKSGAMTVSHLRFDDSPIDAPYLIDDATFVACHQFEFLLEDRRPRQRRTMERPSCSTARTGRTRSGTSSRRKYSRRSSTRSSGCIVVDATAVAREAGLGQRTNTVLQTCFFALSDLMPIDDGIAAIKHAIDKSYAKFGEVVVARNHARGGWSGCLALHEVAVPDCVTSTRRPCADRYPTMLLTSSPERHGHDARRSGRLLAVSACCRSTGPSRPGPPSSRSDRSPSTSRSSTPTSASSAPSVRWCAHTLPFA